MNTPINYARGLGAIFLGFLALAGIDILLTAFVLKFLFASATTTITITETMGLLAIKVISGLVAGYIAAALAGGRRWQHALVFAVIILGLGLLRLQVMTEEQRSAFTTYALVLSPLCIAIGGWLRHRKAA